MFYRNGGLKMGEVYHEQLIKKKMTYMDYVIRAIFVVLCFFPVPFLFFSNTLPYAVLLILALGYLAKFMFQRTDVEYEYLYLSGECQFDRICGKTKRKGCGKLEMDKVEIVAPEGSEKLEEFEKQAYKVRDFSSQDLEVDNRYIAFQRNNSTLIKVIFEPNDSIIKEMKMISPRKVNLKGENSYF